MNARRCYVDGPFGQLHARRLGPTHPPSAPPLVLVHQTPSSSREYDALIAEMARDRVVIAFDTPGYGMSDPPPAPPTIEQLAAALLAGLEGCGLGDARVDLFGYHTGTLIAAEMARLAPARVARLALSGIPWGSPEHCAARLAAARATPKLGEDGAALFARLGWLWDFSVTQRNSGMPLARAAALFAERAYPLERYWWAYEGVWTYPIAHRFAKIAQPVLVLLAQEPLLEPSRTAAAFLPDARLLELPQLDRDIFEPGTGLAAIAAALRNFMT